MGLDGVLLEPAALFSAGAVVGGLVHGPICFFPGAISIFELMSPLASTRRNARRPPHHELVLSLSESRVNTSVGFVCGNAVSTHRLGFWGLMCVVPR